MQYIALEYLYKELRRERTGLGRAEKRPGHTDEEIRNIHRKIDILEYIIGIVTAKGDDHVDVEKALDFIKSYAFSDKEEVYTNGSLLVQFFRVEQALKYKAYNGMFESGC